MIIFLCPKRPETLDFSGFCGIIDVVDFLFLEVSTVIEKGNMTDAEYIAVLEKEHLRLKSEIKKRDKKIDKLEVENECLRKDNHIFLEALILSKHKIFGASSERTECEDQQSFSMKPNWNVMKRPKNL